MRQALDTLTGSLSVTNLFPETPEFSFVCESDVCPRCGAPLKVLKTRPRKAATLHIGHFRGRETVRFCDCCADHPLFRSRELSELVPDGCNFGYDIMVFVGLALFQRLRTVGETRAELAGRNVPISESEVRDLAARFIISLSIAHTEAAPRLREHLGLNGGYILHLDATCQKNSAHLMTGIDEISGLVLLNARMPTETGEAISIFLRDLVQRYGRPVAVSCDMSSANLSALAETLSGVPVFLCHFHFLRDLGNDLMGDDYRIIRERLRRHGPKSELKRLRRELRDRTKTCGAQIECLLAHKENRTVPSAELLSSLPPDAVLGALVGSALEAGKEGGGYGFPFDRPHYLFRRQLASVLKAVEALREYAPLDVRTKRLYDRAVKAVEPICADPELRAAADRLERKAEIFDRLRQAMRIAEPDRKNGLNDDGSNVDIRTIETEVNNFRAAIRTCEESMARPGVSAMLEQIDKYADRLFCDPVRLQTSDGERFVQPQRTNNILERFFRGLNRAVRKRTGHRLTARILDNMLPDVPLIANLQNPAYLRILLNGSPTLEKRLATIDRKLVSASLAQAREPRGGLPRKPRAVLRKCDAPLWIAVQILEKTA